MNTTLVPIIDMQQARVSHLGAGTLRVIAADGTSIHPVTPVRAFPLAAPDEGLSLVGPSGQELAWVDHFGQLPSAVREPIMQALVALEFVPVISNLQAVSSFATPSTWAVETDRGPTEFVLKAEEDIRRLGPGMLLIASAHGVQFLIRDTAKLSRESRQRLERFL
jgi:hypothetical protein